MAVGWARSGKYSLIVVERASRLACFAGRAIQESREPAWEATSDGARDEDLLFSTTQRDHAVLEKRGLIGRSTSSSL